MWQRDRPFWAGLENRIAARATREDYSITLDPGKPRGLGLHIGYLQHRTSVEILMSAVGRESGGQEGTRWRRNWLWEGAEKCVVRLGEGLGGGRLTEFQKALEDTNGLMRIHDQGPSMGPEHPNMRSFYRQKGIASGREGWGTRHNGCRKKNPS